MLERRVYTPELMDSAAFDDTLAAQSFRFIERVNRWFGGERIVWSFVRHEARRQRLARPLRILDIGSGSCDIPLAVCRRAARAGLAVEFVCVERSPQTLALARARLAAEPSLPIRLVAEDIFMHRPDAPYDAAVGSLFFHHLTDDEIRTLVGHLATVLRGPLLINDLGRCWPHYLGAALLCLGLPAGVRHDALLSIRRGFRPHELAELLRPLPGLNVAARWAWPYRVAAVLTFAGARSG